MGSRESLSCVIDAVLDKGEVGRGKVGSGEEDILFTVEKGGG